MKVEVSSKTNGKLSGGILSEHAVMKGLALVAQKAQFGLNTK